MTTSTIHIPPSERLKFQLMTEADDALLFQLDQDPEVMRFVNGGEISTMDDIHMVYLPRMKSYHNENQGWGVWKVSLRENDQFVGWILVRPADFFNDNTQWDNLELGWRFFKKQWGKGYATESARAIINELKKSPKVSTFSAMAMEENTASTHVMGKLGMKYINKSLHKDPLGDMELVYYEMPAINPR